MHSYALQYMFLIADSIMALKHAPILNDKAWDSNEIMNEIFGSKRLIAASTSVPAIQIIISVALFFPSAPECPIS